MSEPRLPLHVGVLHRVVTDCLPSAGLNRFSPRKSFFCGILHRMTGEDAAVPIIGSDSERRENGEARMEQRRSDAGEKAKLADKEEDEDMDGGGWAWVVVLGEFLSTILHNLSFCVSASFLCNMVIDGLGYSFGVLLELIQTEFKVSFSASMYRASLHVCMYRVLSLNIRKEPILKFSFSGRFRLCVICRFNTSWRHLAHWPNYCLWCE